MDHLCVRETLLRSVPTQPQRPTPAGLRLSATPHPPKDDKFRVHFRHLMGPLPPTIMLRTPKNVEGRFSSDCFSSTSTNRKVLNVRRTWTDKLSRFSSMS